MFIPGKEDYEKREKNRYADFDAFVGIFDGSVYVWYNAGICYGTGNYEYRGVGPGSGTV